MADEDLNISEVSFELGGGGLQAGTSRSVKIKLPRSDVEQVIDYEVTDQAGNRVQSQRFRAMAGVDSIQSYIEAPPTPSGAKLKVEVKVTPEDQFTPPSIVETSIDLTD